MATRYGWMADTSEKAFQYLMQRMREMPPGEKFLHVLEMMEMGKRAAEERARREYPNASEREIFLRGAAYRIGPELVRRVYGWDPEEGSATAPESQ